MDISNKMSGELDSKYPGKTAFVTGDVSKRDTWTEALNCAITSFGQLDILVVSYLRCILAVRGALSLPPLCNRTMQAFVSKGIPAFLARVDI